MTVTGTFESISRNPKILKKIKRFLAKLEENTVYKVLVLNIREGKLLSCAPKSLYASKTTNPDFLLKHFLNQTSVLVHKYGVAFSVVQCILASKPWLKSTKVKGNINKLLEVLEKENALKLSNPHPQESLDIILEGFKKFRLDDMRKYDSISMYDYGKLKSYLKNGDVVYKNGKYVLHVTKTRASKKKDLNATNSVTVSEGMKYILR
jgi:hypothetical protein